MERWLLLGNIFNELLFQVMLVLLNLRYVLKWFPSLPSHLSAGCRCLYKWAKWGWGVLEYHMTPKHRWKDPKWVEPATYIVGILSGLFGYLVFSAYALVALLYLLAGPEGAVTLGRRGFALGIVAVAFVALRISAVSARDSWYQLRFYRRQGVDEAV